MTHRFRFGVVLIAALLLATVSLGIVACSSSSGPEEGGLVASAASDVKGKTAPAKETSLTLGGVPPAKSDTLMLAYNNDPDTLNLLTSNDTISTAFQRWVYEPLAEQKFDNPDEYEPVLAESWEFDEDKLEYTIHLRRGVKWHPMTLPDGTSLPAKEFTSKDVKFTFDCVLNPNVEAASLRSYFEDPEATDASQRYKIKVSVVDDYTVKIKWTKPYFLADEFTLGMAILPRHVYSVDEQGEPISFDFSSKEFADGFNNHWANTRMCGTGPLMHQEWKRDESLALKRNPNYWGAPFFFSKVTFLCIPNTNTMLQKVLQNDLDWAGIPEKDLWVQSKDHANVLAGKVHLKDYDYPGYRYIGYNVRRPFLSEKQVRTALAHAIPVQTIIDEVFKGLAIPLSGPFQPGSTAYDESIQPLAFDLDRARSLLEEAGWTDSDADGIRDKEVEGQRTAARYDLMIYADAPAYLTIAEIIKSNCRQIGVDVEITPAKWALMLQRLRKKDFDAAMLGWAMSWRQDPFQIWHSSQADVPESSNSIAYENPEVDKLIEELRVTFDRDRQTELYHQIHRLIHEDQPYTFLFVDKATAGAHARIEGLSFYKIRPGYDAREWYGSKPRR